MVTRRVVGEETGTFKSVNNREPDWDRSNREMLNYRCRVLIIAIGTLTLARACRSYISRVFRTGVLAWLGAVSLGAIAAHAQDSTWLLNPGSGDFNTAANWTPAAVPTVTGIFSTSTTTSITFSSATASVGALQFNSGAPAYSFTLSGNKLDFTGSGIVNNSSNIPIITNTGFPSLPPTTVPGIVEFFNTSTAGNVAITNSDTAATDFFNSSTAGTATITNGNLGGTFFHDTSAGDQARFITNTGGFFDISQLTSAGTTAGSIEGAGSYLLGAKELTVGLNNLSTEVSGSIADGGLGGGTGGSLIKVGTGTLTLSGANTYTGGTIVNAGTLQLGDGIHTTSLAGRNGSIGFHRRRGHGRCDRQQQRYVQRHDQRQRLRGCWR